MFYCERGQMSICHQTTDSLSLNHTCLCVSARRQEFLKYNPVVFSRLNQPGTGLIKPALYTAHSRVQAQRSFEYAFVCADA